MEGSQASSRASSPTAEMLTPRSKVAKMLADIDDAPTPSPPQTTTTISKPNALTDNNETGDIEETLAAPGLSSAQIQVRKGPFQDESDHGSEEDDEDEPVRRPQGKAARRMLGLQRKSSDPQIRTKAILRSSPPPQHQDANSDDELYAATPLRPRDYSKELSGSPFGSARSSGALFVSPAKSAEQAGSGDEDELPDRPVASKERLAQLIAQKREERLQREHEEREQTRLSAKVSKANRKRRRPSAHASSDLPEGIVDDGEVEPNPDVERIMSDAARPTRKASKKALLEMERETQRLARQQALAHQMKVKKKFTTSDLFAKFNFKQSASADQLSPAAPVEDTTTSSAANSDALQEPVSTPPSSPPTAGPTPLDKQKALVDLGALSKMVPVREDSITSLAQMVDDDDEELPDIADVLRSTQAKKPAQDANHEPSGAVFESKDPESARKGLRLARLGKSAMRRQPQHGDSSDDDLDIIARLPAHLRAFDNIKPSAKATADSKAIHTLRHLSHIGADQAMRAKPGKANSRPSIGPKTLEAQLRRKAKEQARQQQRERIEELKAKGVVIQSAEEREREAEVFEDLLEKARQEAVALRKAERAAEKEGAGGEGAANEASDDEDEEYVATDEEDEEAQGEDGEDEAEGEEAGEGLLDEAAEEVEDDDEADAQINDDDEVDADPLDQDTGVEEDNDRSEAALSGLGVQTPAPGNRKFRHSRVVRDDDEEEEEHQDGVSRQTPNQEATTDQNEDDPFAAFGFNAHGNSDDSLLSPTQAFQATMYTPTQATQDDSFDILRRIAPPSISTLPPTMPAGYGESQVTQQEDSQASVVPGSQVPESQRIQLDWETQPQPETPSLPGLQRGVSGLSETPGWEPTQDDGLPSPWTAGLRRAGTMNSLAEDHETQSTVQLRVSESPAAATAPLARRGRLVRRQAAILADSSEDEAEPSATTRAAKKDAFREMAKRRQAALTDVEKAEAAQEMKRMLEEQAEESEDEYAGLGGDDYVAPENEQDREMIDSSHVDVDERELARIYAERKAKEDEASMQQLMKDVGGAWRKRQTGNALDLEDDVDIAIRRREMRRAEEARKRKLLLQDDNIKGLAEGKQSRGKDAFLKAIADDDDGEDMVDISDDDDENAAQETQTESQDTQQGLQLEASTAGPLKEVSGNKRRLADDDWKAASDRPPAKQRRTQAGPFRKAIDEEDVSQNISFLLDEPDAGLVGPTVDLDSDTEPEQEREQENLATSSDSEEDDDLEELELARQNDGGHAPNPADFDRQAMPPPRLPASQRRTTAGITQGRDVVDRLSLKRGSSASSTDGPLSRSAWAAPANGGGAFKGPSLLRRATTNMGTSAANDRGVTVRTASLGRENSSGGGVKMGGSKKSSLAYQARAEERRAIVEASARRREENTQKIAQMRRNSSVLGRGLTGRFE